MKDELDKATEEDCNNDHDLSKLVNEHNPDMVMKFCTNCGAKLT